MPEPVHAQRLLPLTVALISCFAPLAAEARRALTPEDWYRFQAVSDLEIARDGAAVAYLVTSYDKTSDESRAALWTSDWSGNHGEQVTHGESVSEPRFSPDGRSLSFLSARPSGATTQLWILDRQGGEPRQLTHVSGEITAYEWSPDGAHIVLVMHGVKDEHGEETPGKLGEAGKPRKAEAAAKPLVIDAYQFKEDQEGYLTAASRTHLYLLDVRSGNIEALTSDAERADSRPAFSPDGRQIAYVSRRAGGVAEDIGIDELYLVSATAGAKPRRLVKTWTPNHQHLEWSPDGRLIAFLIGDEPKFNAYILDDLAVVEVASGHVRDLTDTLDRAVLSPVFTSDGRAIQFAVEDGGFQYPAQVVLATGAITHLGESMVVSELQTSAGHTAVLATSDASAVEVCALEAGKLRPLSAHNRALLDEIALGTVEDIAFTSHDGTVIHGQIVKPPDFVQGHRYPTILWIHGGPNGQDRHELVLEGYGPPLERQLFATHGYLVLAVNYRGSSGRGKAFARSIFADRGHKEVEDLLAGIDYAVAKGIADPGRLALGGWSYGGTLTDYLMASDSRFRAAISGAGSANQLTTYGTDEHIVEYNAELGPPWRNPALWTQVSYPFFHADRIRTPTLFLGGDKDFNAPIAGGEQMYQALRTLGIPTQLIVYPGEYRVLTRPSFLVDRSRRYLAWIEQYLGPSP
jgi:dipeptidyl aminopeptidase/acylaminoacyl peptidase